MTEDQQPINQTDELIEEFIADCEKKAAELEITVDYYLANGEEYAYLFENKQWECYDLHYPAPQIVEIKEQANVS